MSTGSTPPHHMRPLGTRPTGERRRNTMQMTQSTCIDELTTVGQELAEEHLTLAAGGRRPVTGGPTYGPDGRVSDSWRGFPQW